MRSRVLDPPIPNNVAVTHPNAIRVGIKTFIHDSVGVCHATAGLAHQLTGALVFGEGVAEGDLLLREARFFTARSGSPDVLGDLDEFLEHLRDGDGVGVVARDCRFQTLGEALGLGHVTLGLRPYGAGDQLLQGLDGQVALLHFAHLGEELV